MLRERMIKRIAKTKLLFNSKKALHNMLGNESQDINDENIFRLYKKVFTNTKQNGEIELSNIGKVYENGFKAVHNFNLDIEEHEFISLLGPSGCGKTTILRMIAGLELISEGQLKMGGVTMNSSLPRERGLAMVFQNYALYPYMTVYENIAFGLKNNTFTNGTSNELLIKTLDAINPIYSKIKLIKAKIYHEKHSNKKLLDQIKLEIIKEKKVGINNQLLIDLKIRYKTLKVQQQEYRNGIGKQKNAKYMLDIKNLRDEDRKAKKEGKHKPNKEAYKEALNNYVNSIIIWKKSIKSRINYFSKMVGIQDYLRRKPHALSGGQRQRVALVRAISKDASLFLFDEPLSNLDAKLRGTMRTEIRQLHNSLNSSSIFVTHDQVEAMTMSDRIVLMNKGYIQQVGTPTELFNSPSNIFVADFIGSPGINFVNGILESKNKIKLGKKTISFSKKTPEINKMLDENKGKKVIIGIRPQNVITDENLISHAKENIFDVEVISVESIGHENIVNVKCPELGSSFKVVGGRYFTPAPKTKIKVTIDQNSIYIFDNENGFSISSLPNKATLEARKVWIGSKQERVKNQILSHNEKSKEKLSHKLIKDAYGMVDRKYGTKRKEAKQKIKDLKHNAKDQSLLEQISGQGGN